MKAAVFKRLGDPLAIENVNAPRPCADEVLVRVGYCGICGSDLHMTQEVSFGIVPGTVLGHEFSGEIVEVGSHVTGAKIGDRVAVAPVRGCGRCADCLKGEPAWCSQMLLQGGGYADYAVAKSWQCVKLPQTASLQDGAIVEPLAVALHAVRLARLRPGARVLIMGAGPIGLAVAFWARRLAIARIAVIDLTTLQANLAHEVGATAFIQSGEGAAAAVCAALGGAPEVVFECVGRPGVLAQALHHVAARGSIVMLGLCTTPDSFIPFQAISKEVRFIASVFFDMREFEAALDALDGGRVSARALITNTVSLDEMPATFETLRHRTSQCKVMVRPGCS